MSLHVIVNLDVGAVVPRPVNSGVRCFALSGKDMK